MQAVVSSLAEALDAAAAGMSSLAVAFSSPAADTCSSSAADDSSISSRSCRAVQIQGFLMLWMPLSLGLGSPEGRYYWGPYPVAQRKRRMQAAGALLWSMFHGA